MLIRWFSFLSRIFLIVFLIVLSLAPYLSAYATEPLFDYQFRAQPVVAPHGMVVSQEARASMVGQAVLRQGGNAVDAAVAVGFALAVTLPRAGNLGGGGFMLVYLADQQKTVAIDYREMAPLAAHADMFLDANGQVDEAKARFSLLSAGVPGTVAGLLYAHQKYGKLPLKEVMQPAILMAENGIQVSDAMAEALEARAEHLARSVASKAVFFHNGRPLIAGELLVQSDLAWSLKRILQTQGNAFYQGEIAAKIVAAMQQHQGMITLQDLQNYQVIERAPVTGRYRDYQIVSMPPPSSGGIHLIQMLNMLEAYPLSEWGANSANSIHVMVAAMKRAYADRSEYLGDPSFVEIPTTQLLSKAYAAKLRESFNLKQITASAEIKPQPQLLYESDQTTHFSVADAQGNLVSNTYTLNFSFGSGHMVAGTGILMNNEMDDFVAKVGVANAYGLLGNAANQIQPRKRPLSSMTPTFVFDKARRPVLITGSPGGSRIITTVLQQIVNYIDHQMNLAETVMAPRIHHQWYPDVLYHETGLSMDTQTLLQQKGHMMQLTQSMGSVQAIARSGENWHGFADLRRPGALAIGY